MNYYRLSYVLNNADMLKGDMKTCYGCGNSFKPYGPEKGCSIKCKILAEKEITPNGCWLFKKSTSGPYSKIRWKMKWISAHKASYETFIGLVPQGKWVCHSCDVPKCINPQHLFVGSPQENKRDCIRKKRDLNCRGENNFFAKFTDEQVDEMRKLKLEGFNRDRLCRIFNCSYAYLHKVLKNKLRIGD